MQATPTDSTNPLTVCDREPIHIISGVQDRGFLLAFTPDDFIIRMMSENVVKILARTSASVLNMELRDVLDHVAAKRIALEMDKPAWAANKKAHFVMSGFLGQGDSDFFLYQTSGLVVLEIELGNLHVRELPEGGLQADELNYAIEEMKEAPDLAVAGKALCAAIRSLTGMDRVMVYRFLPPEMHGEVIAESKVAEAHSFNHHRFPASDIPKPARDLYLRNRARFIHDSSAEPSKLVPPLNPLNNKPLDMSDSRLRAVSPIHLEYLRNMGVATSFSTAIVVDDKLWGLVACHHPKSLLISHSVRTWCELLSNAYAVRVRLEHSAMQERQRVMIEDKLTPLLSRLSDSSDPKSELFRYHREIETAYRANGIAYVEGQTVDLAGLTPPKNVLIELAPIVLAEMKEKKRSYFMLETLDNFKPLASTPDTSGLLAIKLPGEIDALVLIFRSEVIQNVQWGGDPHKILDRRDYQGRINPRLSFSSYEETIRNRSEPWNDSEIEYALSFFDIIFTGLVKKERLIRELSERLGEK